MNPLELLIPIAATCLARPSQLPLLDSESSVHKVIESINLTPEAWTVQTNVQPCVSGPACHYRTNLRIDELAAYVGYGLLADVSIGTPPQYSEAFIDFMSMPFYFMNCSATSITIVRDDWRAYPDYYCYNERLSQTARSTNTAASIEWTFIYASGTIANDVFQIGDAKIDVPFLKGATYENSGAWFFEEYSSTMGLSRTRNPQIEPDDMQSPMRKIFEQQILDHSIVAFEWAPTVDNNDHVSIGTMSLGSLDRKYTVNRVSIDAVPLDQLQPDFKATSDWQVRGLEVRAADITADLSNMTVMFKLQYPWVGLPDEFVYSFGDYVNSHLENTDVDFGDSDELPIFWINEVDCDERHKLPIIYLKLSTSLIPEYDPWEFAFGGYDYTSEYTYTNSTGHECNSCRLHIQKSSSFMEETNYNPNGVFLGWGFMRGFYTAFNYDAGTIDIAKRVP